MANKKTTSSTALADVNPIAHEQRFLLNKPATDLETLRKNFTTSPSSVLGKVRDFLPKLAVANEELQRKLLTESASTVDIENVEEDAPHIEMSIALVDQGNSESDDAVSDEEDSCSSCDIQVGAVDETNIKLPQQAHKHPGKPLVEIIDTLQTDTDAKERATKVFNENTS